MTSIWANLSAAKLQQQLSDVAKELVASEDNERGGLANTNEEETPTTELDSPGLKSAISATTAATDADEPATAPKDTFVVSVTEYARLKRELEIAQTDAKRLKSYLLEAQSEYESEILNLQKQLDQFTQLGLEHARLQETTTQLSALLAQSQEREHAARTSLTAMEMILANAQADQEQEIAIRTAQLQRQLTEAQHSLVTLKTVQEQTHNFESQVETLKQQNAQLQAQLDRASAACRAMHTENQTLKASLEQTVSKISSQASASETSIDKRIIRNLVVSFLNPRIPSTSKSEILEIMSRMLNMTEEERQSIGASKPASRSWLQSFVFGGSESQIQDSPSLSTLWVQYLATATDSTDPAEAGLRSAPEDREIPT